MRRVRLPGPISNESFPADVPWLNGNLPAPQRHLHVPRATLPILQHRNVFWARGYALSDERPCAPVTAETVFEACSMAKPVLALVAMQLVQEGSLDLDRPLVEYLGGDYLPDQPEHRRITARMALTHRTGFVNWRAGYDEMGGPLPLQFAPGSEYAYSGEGILFLQRAIEAVSGQPLDRLAEERLFAPLGLRRTGFVWTEALEADLASGHRDDGSYKARTRYLAPNAAYSLYTTPTEYARVMLTLQHPELLGDRALTRSTTELMLQRQLRVDDDGVPRPGSRGPSRRTARSAGAWTSRRRATSSSIPGRTARDSVPSASSTRPRARASSSSRTATGDRACARQSSSASAICSPRAAGRGSGLLTPPAGTSRSRGR
jgi:CubicO group peptidase (beta-lactamase class C family)